MTRRTHSTPRLFSRREVLALGAGLGAAALGIAPARAADTPVLMRPIPRTGERLAVIGCAAHARLNAAVRKTDLD